jgi:flagellar basal body-associated protein FliL/ribosomal protein S13
MNTVSEYLKQYLTFNRSVSVGMLGIFSSQHTGASIHPVIHEFHPPSALLSFEEDASCETTNNFILFVAKHANTSIKQASEMIDNFRSDVWSALKTDTSFHIIHFGTFKRLPNHSTDFEQDDNIQLNAMAFGLPSFILQSDGQMVPTKTEEQSNQQDNIPETIETAVKTEPIAEVQHQEARIILPKMEIPQKPVVEQLEPEQQEVIPETIETVEETEPIEEVQHQEARIILPKMEIPQKPVVEQLETEQQEVIPETIETTPVAEFSVEDAPPPIVEQQAIPPKKKKRKKTLVWILILLVFAASGGALYVTGYWAVVYEKAKTIAGTEVKTETAETTEGKATSTEKIPQTSSEQPIDENDTSQTMVEDQTQEHITVTPKHNQDKTSQHHKYFIVADCFRDIQLAEKRVKDLQSQGYNSSLAGQTKQGLHIVTYGGFSEKADAENMLKEIQKDVQGDSWLYIK